MEPQLVRSPLPSSTSLPDSVQSAHFRHSISTPGVESRRPKRYEPLILKWWIIAFTACLMMGLAIALEIALWFSYKKQGFSVPKKNVFSFLSTQFLTTFFPTIIIYPLTFLWGYADQALRWYQPYLTLANGRTSAEESLLLDYVTLGKPKTLLYSFRYRHWLVFFSAITALITILLQPLTGSVLEIKQTPSTQPGTVTSTRTVGLAPDAGQLNAFVAAAGFVGAAVFDGLPDPPFILGGWAAAEFTFPKNPGLNGSMVVDTVGIQTKVNCALPSTSNLNVPRTGDNTIQAISAQGCTSTVTFDPSSSEQQYGVVAVPNCGSATNDDFRPVMFWYFHTNAQAQPEARAVFCQPTIGIFNIQATANLNNGSLANVTVLSGYAPSNNVTSGQAFNGVVFDTSSSDKFVQARATAVNSGVPGAIFRFASQQPNGAQATFDNPNGFLDTTNHVYTQHLSLVAKSVYYVAENQTLPAQMTSLVPKLWISPLAAHGLSAVLIAIALAGLYVHVSHGRSRHNLWLTSPPGSIASIVALTSRSGFGELLSPNDDEATLERKLAALRFYLDQRTGAILADDEYAYHAHMGPDDTMMSLLGNKHDSNNLMTVQI